MKIKSSRHKLNEKAEIKKILDGIAGELYWLEEYKRPIADWPNIWMQLDELYAKLELPGRLDHSDKE